jgi:nitrogen-specific signal transduction histidine kinase
VLLTGYAPTSQLAFDKKELKGLHVLRGRASHAESRVGIEELVDVERLVSDQPPRLKKLVERVIATEKPGANPAVALTRCCLVKVTLAPDGEIVVIQPGPK